MSSSRCQQDAASGHHLNKLLQATSCSVFCVYFCCLSFLSCFPCFCHCYVCIYVLVIDFSGALSVLLVFVTPLAFTQSFCLLATPSSETDVTSTCLVAPSHNCRVAMSINAGAGLSCLPTSAACSAISLLQTLRIPCSFYCDAAAGLPRGLFWAAPSLFPLHSLCSSDLCFPFPSQFQ